MTPGVRKRFELFISLMNRSIWVSYCIQIIHVSNTSGWSERDVGVSRANYTDLHRASIRLINRLASQRTQWIVNFVNMYFCPLSGTTGASEAPYENWSIANSQRHDHFKRISCQDLHSPHPQAFTYTSLHGAPVERACSGMEQEHVLFHVVRYKRTSKYMQDVYNLLTNHYQSQPRILTCSMDVFSLNG